MHPQYKKSAAQWEACRDWAEGAAAVKEKGATYLPPLDIHIKESGATFAAGSASYKSYLKRAVPFEAFRNTVRFMAGLAFHKAPVYKAPDVIATSDMDGNFNKATSIHRRIFAELLTVTRGGVFVDWDETPGRAYVKLHRAEDITDWNYDADGKLVLVDIDDYYIDREEDEPVEKKQTIEMRIEGGVFVYRIVQEDKDGARIVISTRTPERPAGKPMTEIPFIFYSEYGIGAKFSRPVMYGIVVLSQGHYCLDADLRHGAALSARPVFYTVGDMPDRELIIGSSTAWNLPAEASVGMVQFESGSLDTLMKMQSADEQKMAAIGAKMLEPKRRGVESAEAKRIEVGTMTSIMGELAETSVMVMNWILREMALWHSADPDEIEYAMDTDFIPEKMTADELRVLMDAVDRGKMTLDTFLFNVKKGGLMQDDKTVEDEKDGLKLGAPASFAFSDE